MLLHDRLFGSADRHPERLAVVGPPGSTSYADLSLDAARIARILADSRVSRGDRVLLALENSPLWVAAFFGILQTGAVVVPFAPGRKNDRLAAALLDCGPTAGIVDEPTAGAMAQAPTRVPKVFVERRAAGGQPADRGAVRDVSQGPDDSQPWIDLRAAMQQVPAEPPHRRIIDIDLAAIIYTSGSTGAPRGVMLSHLNLTSNAESIVQYLRLESSDRVMVVLPFHYVYGLSLLTTHVSVGGGLAIDNRFAFPNAILATMQQCSVTGFAGVPSTFALLLHRSSIDRMAFPSLRYVTQAGGPMPPALLQRWLTVMPAVPFYVMYGATEASARLAYLDPAELPSRIGSIGKAIPNVELNVIRDDGAFAGPGEVGEIVARGSNIMMGYWNAPEETRLVLGPHGYRTGDLARYDTDGYLYIVGRQQDMLKVGAERVGAREIEDVLNEHPAVLEAAVVGAVHELLGEVPVAYVAVSPDGSDGAEAITAFCRTRLADHKVPVRIVTLPELPKNAAGKVDKSVLRREFTDPASVR